ncbi:MAG: DUF3106 domain-containing protein [Burkholderiaceae bacterium]
MTHRLDSQTANIFSAWIWVGGQGAVAFGLVTLLALSCYANAQVLGATNSSAKTVFPDKEAAASTKTKPVTKPNWSDLTPTQQQALQPLASSWAELGAAQKRKWLALSKNYPDLPVEEQTKLHSRMQEWVKLSQHERSHARLNFAESQKISASERSASWLAYQALNPDEKKKLAASAAPKEKGAAVAVQPVAAQKLATIPTPVTASERNARIGVDPRGIDLNTLLPLPTAESAPAQKNQTDRTAN